MRTGVQGSHAPVGTLTTAGNTRYPLDLSSSSIVVRENDTVKKRIREAIEIHCQAPTLNRDVGYELSAIDRDVLSRDILPT